MPDHEQDTGTGPAAPPVLASFPRSGRTWLATLVHGAVGGSADAGLAMLQGDDHRALLTHDDFEPTLHRGPTVLLLRDPADQLVSFFHYMRDHLGDYDGDLSASMAAEHQGIPRLARWYNSWGRLAAPDYVTTYERLRGDTVAELDAVLAGLGLRDQVEVALDRIVTSCDFALAHAVEASAGGPDRPTDALFARQGRIRASREVLNAGQVDSLFEQLRGELTAEGSRLFDRGGFRITE